MAAIAQTSTTLIVNGTSFILSSSLGEDGVITTFASVDGIPSANGIEPIDVKIQRASRLAPPYNTPVTEELIKQKEFLESQNPEAQTNETDTTNDPQDPAAPDQVPDPDQNQADDDSGNGAVSGENQSRGVIAAGSGVATSTESSGTSSGNAANPGPSGTTEGGFSKPGKRIYNPLSKLASYTYNISLYIITPDAYAQFIESGRQKIDAIVTAGPISEGNGVGAGAYVIAQSGGINNKTQKRAPGFELDYYIDNLRFKTVTLAKDTGTSAVAVQTLKFTISEPYGFSFVSNLQKASAALRKYSDSTSYKELTNSFKDFFILGIKFYGYDINGNLIKPDDQLYGSPLDPNGGDALFENYYDIRFKECKFQLNGKTVTYEITATGLNGATLLGTKRGRMPTGTNIEGRTIEDALTGPKGLFSNLNKQQEDLAKGDNPSLTFPNKYNVVFLGDAATKLANASMVTESDLAKWRWGGSGATTTDESNDSAGTAPPNNTVRQFTFNNDTSIIQAIQQIVSQSKFTENALKVVFTNSKQPDPEQKGTERVVKDQPATFQWFNVNAEVKKADWDPKIQDWAYETNYVIQLYDVPSIESPYTQAGKSYYGPHKRYDYWFTGQNSEVLDFQLQFNFAYFNVATQLQKNTEAAEAAAGGDSGAGREAQQIGSGSGSGSATGNTSATSGNTGLTADAPAPGQVDKAAGSATGGGAVSVTPGLRSGGDSTGKLGQGAEAQNSVLTYLTDPGAYQTGKIKILGDPDFLINDSTSSINEFYNKFYGSDGYTISAQGGQVFIEVALKEAIDYKNSEGILTLNENILFFDYPEEVKKISKGAIIYMVREVESVMQGGKFEQTLTLVGPTFGDGGTLTTPTDTSTAPSTEAAASSQSTVNTPNGPEADDDSNPQSGNGPTENEDPRGD